LLSRNAFSRTDLVAIAPELVFDEYGSILVILIALQRGRLAAVTPETVLVGIVSPGQ
jgi:hypothetical protein